MNLEMWATIKIATSDNNDIIKIFYIKKNKTELFSLPTPIYFFILRIASLYIF